MGPSRDSDDVSATHRALQSTLSDSKGISAGGVPLFSATQVLSNTAVKTAEETSVLKVITKE